MDSLVGYGSSDEEDDIQSEKPAKIAKTEANAPPAATSHDRPVSTTKADPSPPLHLPSDAATERGNDSVETGPSAGPAAPPHTAPPDDLGSPPISPYTFERQRLRELTMPTVPNFDIPNSPPPPARNSEEAATLAATTKKFERFLELKKQGVHFNERLQNSSSLRNPSLLPKLMDFAGISQEDSYKSSLLDEVAVPVKWPEDCYIENLLRQNERKEKKRIAERDKVDFVPASKSSASSAAGTPANTGKEERRSRFDKK